MINSDMLVKSHYLKPNNVLKVFIIIVSLAFSLLSLKYFTAPYVWICLSWFLVFLLFIISSNRTSTRITCLYISIIIFTFGIFEIYLSFIAINRSGEIHSLNEGTKSNKLWVEHDILGYAPVKNNTITTSRYRGNKLIYKATYTIDSDGLRISPPYELNNKGCILFFGGSFTYGEGLNDNETLPYLTGIKTGKKFHVYNFGFHGYGPHQMLSALEHGLVGDIIKYKPRYVIYQAIIQHISRSAGLEAWDIHGPRYILNDNGRAEYAGYFDNGRIASSKRVMNQLLKSAIFRKIWHKYYGNGKRPINNADIELFLGIVDKARDVFESRYPGSEFHILFWDYSNEEIYSTVINGLNKKGLHVHLISHILPDINSSKYSIRGDPHPNASAFEIIAEYIANNIVEKNHQN